MAKWGFAAVLAVAVVMASASPAWALTDVALDDGLITQEGEDSSITLGESLMFSSGKFTHMGRLVSVGGDLSLDLNPYVQPRLFVEYHRARFHRLDFLNIPFDIEEVWFGGGVKVNAVPQWLSLSVMVGTQWYVGEDDHLNDQLFLDAEENEESQGVLLRGVLTITHPERYFRFDLKADFNPDVHANEERQSYQARLTVPVFLEEFVALELGVQANFFTDGDLTYQKWDIGPLLGLRLLPTESSVIGLDLGISYSNEQNSFINRGHHEETASGMITLFRLSW